MTCYPGTTAPREGVWNWKLSSLRFTAVALHSSQWVGWKCYKGELRVGNANRQTQQTVFRGWVYQRLYHKNGREHSEKQREVANVCLVHTFVWFTLLHGELKTYQILRDTWSNEVKLVASLQMVHTLWLVSEVGYPHQRIKKVSEEGGSTIVLLTNKFYAQNISKVIMLWHRWDRQFISFALKASTSFTIMAQHPGWKHL